MEQSYIVKAYVRGENSPGKVDYFKAMNSSSLRGRVDLFVAASQLHYSDHTAT